MRYNKISKGLYLIAIILISISEEIMNFDQFSTDLEDFHLYVHSLSYRNFKFYVLCINICSTFLWAWVTPWVLLFNMGLKNYRSSLGLVILYKTSPQWRSHFVIPNPTSQISFRWNFRWNFMKTDYNVSKLFTSTKYVNIYLWY